LRSEALLNSPQRLSRSKQNRLPGLGGKSTLAILLLCGTVFLLFGAAEQKRISVYSNVANYSLPVTEHAGADYIGLLEVLDPLGSVSAKAKDAHWKLRFNDVEAEFTAGKTRAKAHGKEIELNSPFVFDNGRGLVPLSSLTNILPRLLDGPVTYHDLSRRLFIGNAAVHFTAQVNRNDPGKLVINFTARVDPMISTEPGKLRMLFTHEPLLAPSSPQLTFDSTVIPSATYSEANGAAEIAVNSPLSLIASFSNNGHTITIAPPAPQPAQARPPQSPTAPPGPAPAAQTPQHRDFVVLDAAHGGDDRGAALSDQLAEKDLTLAFARRMRQEFDSRGMPVLMLRDGDTTIPLDQRAATTNAAHPALYICIHVSSEGTGIRLYTAMIPGDSQTRGLFLDWDTAQASFLSASQNVVAGLAGALQRTQLPITSAMAPLRPLNNITVAAVAIEIAPPGKDVAELNSSTYQQSISAAVALGASSLRAQLGAQ